MQTIIICKPFILYLIRLYSSYSHRHSVLHLCGGRHARPLVHQAKGELSLWSLIHDRTMQTIIICKTYILYLIRLYSSYSHRHSVLHLCGGRHVRPLVHHAKGELSLWSLIHDRTMQTIIICKPFILYLIRLYSIIHIVIPYSTYVAVDMHDLSYTTLSESSLWSLIHARTMQPIIICKPFILYLIRHHSNYSYRHSVLHLCGGRHARPLVHQEKALEWSGQN
ncbi:hypothetical protein J6590_038901 [Homalodisca vitripennis]|nr:hypothetical protein J6590_038901 [Homalodisca vitripennis]